MKSLVEVYDQISARDAEYLEKAAQEKLAVEEADAAGRIMARGFADELNKLAEVPGSTGAGYQLKPRQARVPGGPDLSQPAATSTAGGVTAATSGAQAGKVMGPAGAFRAPKPKAIPAPTGGAATSQAPAPMKPQQ